MLTKGTPVTVLFKGAPFANTTVLNTFQEYGTTYVICNGCVDEYSNLAPIALSDIRPVTKGYYLQKPQDTPRTFEPAAASATGKTSKVAAGLI